MSRAVLAIAIALVAVPVLAADPDLEYRRRRAEIERVSNDAVRLFNSGKFADALPIFERVTQQFRELHPKSHYPDGAVDLAASIYNLGIANQIAGNFERAEECLKETLAMRLAMFSNEFYPDGHTHIAFALNALGHVLMQAGKYEEAVPNFERAAAMFRRWHQHDHGDVAHVLGGLGRCWKLAGDYRRSRACYEESLAIYRKQFSSDKHPNGHLHLALEISDFGRLLHDIGDLDGALAHAEEALAMRRRLIPREQQAGHPDIAAALHNVAATLDAMGEHDKALPIFEQALATFRGVYAPAKFPQGHPELAAACENVASLLRRTGRADAALPLQEEAVAIGRKFYPTAKYPDGHAALMRSVSALGRVRHASRDVAAATSLYEESLAMARRLYPATRFPDGHPGLATCHLQLGRARFDAGAVADAVTHFAEALDLLARHSARELIGASEADALTLAETLAEARDAYIAAAAEVAGSDAAAYARVWQTKAVVTRVLERRRLAARAASGTSLAKWLQLQAIGRRINDVMADTAKREATLRQLTERREALERELAATLPELTRSREQAAATPRDLARQLPAEAVFIDFLVYSPLTPVGEASRRPPALAAFVLAPHREAVRVELGPASAINEMIKEWRERIEARSDDRAAAAKLRDRLWRPIAERMPKLATTVYLAPDGDLARVSFAALPGARPGTILLEEFAFAWAAHGPALLEQLRRPARGGAAPALVLGGVQYGEGSEYPYLPGTMAEARQVAAFSGATPPRELTGVAATAERLLAALPTAGYAHLATHGFFAERDLAEERRRVAEFRRGFTVDSGAIGRRVGLGLRTPLAYTGLVLAAEGGRPGIVTGEALVGLSLDDLRLCVLSACETGLGARTGGEGVQGLVRAFHLAGCPNVVASLWKVSDTATAALMAKFYHELWINKRDPLAALREAQLTVYRRPDLIQDLAGERGAPKLKEAVVVSPRPSASAAGTRSDTKLWAAFTLSGAGKKRNGRMKVAASRRTRRRCDFN